MTFDVSFKFMDGQRNRKLLQLAKTAGVKHRVDAANVLHFSSADEGIVENQLVKPLRDEQFASWQLLSCPKEWAERYRQYMRKHGIPFSEELIDGDVCFLIPGGQTPLDWDIPPSDKAEAASPARLHKNLQR